MDPPSSDDDAPEEVTLEQGKQRAIQQRTGEANSRQQHEDDLKSWRAKWSQQATNDEAPDLLPDDLLEAVAASRAQPPTAADLDAAQPRKAKKRTQGGKKKKKTITEVQKGPVLVKVLKRMSQPSNAEAAKSFLKGQLYSQRVKRARGTSFVGRAQAAS